MAGGRGDEPAYFQYGQMNELYSPEARMFNTSQANKAETDGDAEVFRNPEAVENLGWETGDDNPDCSAGSTSNAFTLSADAAPNDVGETDGLGAHANTLFTWERGASSCATTNNACLSSPDPLAFPGGGVLADLGLAVTYDNDFNNEGEYQKQIKYSTAPTPPAGSPGACTFYEWQTCAFPARQEAEEIKLQDVAWPGTHDSGTGSLAATSEYVLSEYSPDCSAGWFSNLTADFAHSLAVSQRTSLREQLDQGIRYLDLRVGWSVDTNQWELVHTLASPTSLQLELQGVAAWANAHPSEVVIVDINHICDASGNPHIQPEFEDAFYAQQIDSDGVETPSLCDVMTPVRRTNVSQMTIEDVRAYDGGRIPRNVIVVLYDFDPSPYSDEFLNEDCQPLVNYSYTTMEGMFSADAPQGPSPCDPGPAQASPYTHTQVQTPFTPHSTSSPDTTAASSTFYKYRSTTNSQMLDASLHWEMSPGDVTDMAVCTQTTLLGWQDRMLSSHIDDAFPPLLNRYEMLSEPQDGNAAWLSCANIITTDDFGSDYATIGGSPDYSTQYVDLFVDANEERAARVGAGTDPIQDCVPTP